MKQLIIFFITFILGLGYLFILLDIVHYFLRDVDYKTRISLGVVGCIIAMFIAALLAGYTYNFLEKKFDRKTWNEYHADTD